MERKIVAILVGDVVGSTSAMEADEEAAVRCVNACLDTVREAVEAHGGRVFNTAGDALLAEFPSPINALRASMAARTALTQIEDAGPRTMRFGLHLADVLALGDDLRGDGVNIAARIQSNADPGQIEVSDALYQQVRRNSPCTFESIGERRLTGVSEPLQLYRVKSAMDRHRFQSTPTRATPRPARRENSIAVLPLKTASSAEEDQQFLADGLREDLTLELSRLPAIYVSSQSAASNIDEGDPEKVGHLLGVAYVLEGSVRRMGPRLRLNLSLTSTQSGEIVWADRIQRPFDEVFDVLDEVTARVAATVAGQIELNALTATRLKAPENMTAYEHYLRGLEHHRLGGVTQQHIHEALKWFRSSRETDPNYSPPYAMEVCSWSYLPDFDIDEAEKLLTRSLELDPTYPEAHRIMGILQIKRFRDYAAGRRHHEKASELAPNDAYIMSRCAAFYIFDGEPERGLEMLERAEALDPFLPVWCTEERVAALYTLERYEEMLAFARSLALQTRRTRLYRAAARAAIGDEARGREHLRDALADDPTLSGEYIRAQELYRDEAFLEKLIERCRALGLPDTPRSELVAI